MVVQNLSVSCLLCQMSSVGPPNPLASPPCPAPAPRAWPTGSISVVARVYPQTAALHYLGTCWIRDPGDRPQPGSRKPSRSFWHRLKFETNGLPHGCPVLWFYSWVQSVGSPSRTSDGGKIDRWALFWQVPSPWHIQRSPFLFYFIRPSSLHPTILCAIHFALGPWLLNHPY